MTRWTATVTGRARLLAVGWLVSLLLIVPVIGLFPQVPGASSLPPLPHSPKATDSGVPHASPSSTGLAVPSGTKHFAPGPPDLVPAGSPVASTLRPQLAVRDLAGSPAPVDVI